MPITAEQKAKLIAYYHLDQPAVEQFRQYVTGTIRGDLGLVHKLQRARAPGAPRAVKWTALLVGVSTILYVFWASSWSSIGWRHGGILDASLLGTSLALGSFPAYFLAMLLIMVFGVKLGALPLGGAQSPAFLHSPWPARLSDVARHMVLPCASLVLTSVGDV